MPRVIMQTDVSVLNICLRFRLLRLLVLPMFRLYNSTWGWGMPLFTPARLLWSHPSYNHSPEGVCTPTLRHRGKSRLKLHSPSASHPSKKSPVYQIPFTSSDSVAMVSKVSPVHCGPLFCLTLINESSGSNALTPVNPIPLRQQVFTAYLKVFAFRYWLWRRLCLCRVRSATTACTPASAGLARGAKFQEKWRKGRIPSP